MSTRDELYQAVLDQPDRDGPRLRYAEYLEKQGDELGEFIRLAVDRVRNRLGDNYDRSLELHNKFSKTLAAQLAPWIKSHQLDRGLVAFADMEAKNFVDHGYELFKRAPIQHAYLLNAKLVFSQIMNSETLLRVQALTIEDNHLTDHETSLLAANPNIRNLIYLNLSGNKIGEAGFEALTASKYLPKLKVLHLDGNLVESPVARYSSDGYSTFYEGFGPFRYVLVEKYGEKAWMEPPQNYDIFRLCDAGE